MLVTVKGVSSEKDPGRRLEVRQTTLECSCLEFLSAASSEPDLQSLLTFQVPNVIPFQLPTLLLPVNLIYSFFSNWKHLDVFHLLHKSRVCQKTQQLFIA